MLIIGDNRIPGKAQTALNKTGLFIPFLTQNITYPAIAGHPDIFFFKIDKTLIVAPNTPGVYKQRLKEAGVSIIEGKSPIGKKYPATARYNAVITPNLLIHNLKITDPVVLQLSKGKKQIHVNQGYTRCNLLPLPDESFITSDEGIYRILKNSGFDVLYVHPHGIILPGFDNGFIGGCAGVFDNMIYFTGSLKYFPEGDKIKVFLKEKNLQIIELYDGPLFDGGSLLFI